MCKADNAWEIHRRMSRADNFISGNTNDFRFIHKKKNNSFLYAADRQRFVVAVQE
jgi:hypothetical protein